MTMTDVIKRIQYPVKVVIFENFENAVDITFHEGRIEKEVVMTEEGALVGWYFRLKNDKSKTKIPAPDMPYYQNIRGVKKLYLLKIDRKTFWPITMNGGKLIVNIPHVVRYKDRNMVMEEVAVLNQDGNPMLDKAGNPVMAKQEKIEFERRPIFDTKLIMKDGSVIELPAMVANENYDKEAWLASEIEKAQRRYRAKGWLQQNAALIITIMGILGCLIIAYYTLQGIPKINQAQIEGLKQTAQIYAQELHNNLVNSTAAPY